MDKLISLERMGTFKEEFIKLIPTNLSNLNNDMNLVPSKMFSLTVPEISTGSLSLDNIFWVLNKSLAWTLTQDGAITFSNLSVKGGSLERFGIWMFVPVEAIDKWSGAGKISYEIIVNDVSLGSSSPVADNLVPGWNYISLGDDSSISKVAIKFTNVTSSMKFLFNRIEKNYVGKPRVMITYDLFDANLYDIVYPILHQSGFKATVACSNSESIFSDGGLTDNELNDLISKGWDWSIKADIDGGATLSDCQSVIDAMITSLEEVGLFNPISYFCSNGELPVNLFKALKSRGIKVARYRGTGKGVCDYFDKNTLGLNSIELEGTKTASDILSSIDNAISSDKSICLSIAQIVSVSSTLGCTSAMLSEVVAGLKSRVDEGRCEVVTLREFYREFEHNDCEEYLYNRVEKQSIWNLGAGFEAALAKYLPNVMSGSVLSGGQLGDS